MLLGLVLAISFLGAAAHAQDRHAASIPSTYEGCMQPAVLEGLVMEGPKSWGLSGDQREGMRAMEGYFLCHAVVGREEDSCSVLQQMPEFSTAKLLGVECKADYHAMRVHEALSQKQTQEAVHHCSRWCRINKTETEKKIICPNVCRKAIEEFYREPNRACDSVIGEAERALGASSQQRARATLFCRQKFTPKPSDCVDRLGSDPEGCRAMIALLAAYEKSDEKRCPKDARYEGVCRAMIRRRAEGPDRTGTGGPEDPADACDENGKRFLKLLCDGRKASGGLRQKTIKAETGEY